MKKKTVITTEKTEVWIIRQPMGKTSQYESDVSDGEAPINSLPSLLEEKPEADVPVKQE
jgi:hypothetical protein